MWLQEIYSLFNVRSTVYKYNVYALIDNQFNNQIYMKWQLLNTDYQQMYVSYPEYIWVKPSAKKVVRFPVLFLQQPQPDQLQGVVGFSARDGGGAGSTDKLLVNGESMFPVNLMSNDESTKRPVKLLVASESMISFFFSHCGMLKLICHV
jgi:hypothetical protein